MTGGHRPTPRACLSLIQDGDSIFLDGGTTQYELARLLADSSGGIGPSRQVKILTNAFKVAEICQSMAEPPIVVGGRYRPSGGCFVGPVAMSTLRQFRLDVAFVGVTGVTEDGFFAADIAEAQVKTEVIGRCQRAVVPLDHSKIGLVDFVAVATLAGVNTVVTDRPDHQLCGWLSAAGVELVTATTAATISDHVPAPDG